MTDAIARIGELIALEYERLWQLDVIDPRIGSTDPRAPSSLYEINFIIGANGWGNVKQADVISGLMVNTSYEGNGKPQWCGMTYGEVARRAAGLDPIWLPHYFASTIRILTWARYQRWSFEAPPNPLPADERDRRLLVKLERNKAPSIEPQRGDLLIVGDGNDPSGDHVTGLVGWDREELRFDAIAGNSGGVGPDGVAREGISRRYYRLTATSGYRPMWLVRLAFGDVRLERGAS